MHDDPDNDRHPITVKGLLKMEPILFWVFGAFSLASGFMAVAHRRPQRSTQGLVVMMMSNAAVLFLLAAPLLAIELIVVTIGAVLVVWMVLVRPGRAKLGVPGRTRYNITKFIAFFVTLWLSLVLLLTIFQSAEPVGRTPSDFLPQGEAGALMAVFLFGVALATAVCLVVSRRRQDDESEG